VSQRADTPYATPADWGVVAFGVGIALYFGLPSEPSLFALSCMLAGIAVGVIVAWRQGVVLPVVMAILCMAAGLGRAGWHTAALDTQTVADRALFYDVEGWVEDLERGSRGLRWIVRVDALDGEAGPHRIRVNISEPAYRPGDGVAFRARLYAPPSPALPGGYDSARAAYFRQIGAYGQVVGDVTSHNAENMGLARALARRRHALADRILTSAPLETAGLQVALITGIRTHIPAAQMEAMRDAGLAHIVAISGLHMAVFAGYSYALLCLIFAGLSRSRLRDMRKPAAAVALGIAAIYLVLSGASVSTQRAFIMIAVWLTAIILERQPFSLRSVSVAAIVTLAFHPEAILSAGFHMSFAAVAALIVAYGWWNTRREFLPASLPRRIVNWFAGLGATSIVAGAATAGFAIIHFGRWARYGLVGNLAAMPVFTAVTMPAAMLSLVALPLELEAIPLRVMGWSLAVVLGIAEWTAALPGSVAEVHGAGTIALIAFAAGFILLLFGRKKLRLAGLATLLALPLTGFYAPQPDIRVSDRGQVTVRMGDALYTTNARADRFGRTLFAERANIEETSQPLARIAACDKEVCSLEIQSVRVAIVAKPSAFLATCHDHDIIILTARNPTPVARRACKTEIVAERELKAWGSLDITLQPTLHIRGAKAKGARPWR